MAKKKKRKKKTKKIRRKAKKKGRVKHKKKVIRRKKRSKKVKARRRRILRKKKIKPVVPVKIQREKLVGIVDHYFGNISVGAIKVKAPIRVGDTVHIKGHTTDFTQRVESMQIEHKNVVKAKKGDDVGIRVKEKVRIGDEVYLAAKERAIFPRPAKPAGLQKPVLSVPLFKKPLPKAPPQPPVPPAPPASTPAPGPQPKKTEKTDPYANVKFFKF